MPGIGKWGHRRKSGLATWQRLRQEAGVEKTVFNKEERDVEKHTKGKLSFAMDSMSVPNTTFSLWAGQRPIAVTIHTPKKEEEDYANAKRLVTCWNALSALTTEEIEGGALERLVKANQNLAFQLATLCAATGTYPDAAGKALDEGHEALKPFEKGGLT